MFLRKILVLLLPVMLCACQQKGVPTASEENALASAVRSVAVTAPAVNTVSPKIAIVVDDIGYRQDRLVRLLALPLPLSFSVIPGTPHDQNSAQMIRARGRDLLVHMPMEPEGYPQIDPGSCALLTSMSRIAITEVLSRCAGRISGAIGMNNHMGSSFTGYRKGMDAVAAWLKKKGMFFVDSLTTPDSTGKDVMKAKGVPWILRDIFADNVRNEQAVSTQLSRVRKVALARGSALLLCHPYEVTIKVLASWVAEKKFAPATVVPVHKLWEG